MPSIWWSSTMLQAVSDVPRWLSVPSLSVLAFIHIHTHSSPSYIFMCIIIIITSTLGDCWPAVVGPRGFVLKDAAQLLNFWKSRLVR